jgi:DNA ligase-associated metallophosphoesterase
MKDYEFTLSGERLVALASGALWVPDAKMLVVADLHFGKAERIARREGRLTPPYEARETLSRLTEVVDLFEPSEVICLGDSFDDDAVAASLSDEIATGLARLMVGRSWIWILGNHDPGPTGLGGAHLAALQRGALVFRHIAEMVAVGEVSGHYHPKVWLRGQGRPAFLIDKNRVILPAFGAYTGGLDVTDAVFDALFGPDTLALLTGQRIIPAPRAKLPVRRR